MISFKVEVDALRRGIDKVKGAVGKRDGIVSLSYILFQVEAVGVTLKAYNQVISAQTVVPLAEPFIGKSFGFAMDGKFASSLSSSVRGDYVEVVFKIDDLAKTGANASFYGTVVSGDAEWSALCIPESSFPSINSAVPKAAYTVSRDTLLGALNKIVPAVTDISRSLSEQAVTTVNSFGVHWRGGYIETGGGGRYMVASVGGAAPVDFVLSPDGVAVLHEACRLGIVETVTYGITADNEAVFRVGTDTVGIFLAQNHWLDLTQKLIDPVDASKVELFSVDRAVFTGAIEQINFLSQGGENGVRLTKGAGGLLIYADDEVGQRGKVFVRASWKSEADYDMAFSWRYLKDLVSAFAQGDDRTITFKEGRTGHGKQVMFLERPGLKGYLLPVPVRGRAATVTSGRRVVAVA